jgi:hypothetical protein
MSNGAVKRALWCRWFHRWRMRRHVPDPVVSSVPGQPGALAMTAGPHRNFCGACEDHPYASRAARRWGEQP